MKGLSSLELLETRPSACVYACGYLISLLPYSADPVIFVTLDLVVGYGAECWSWEIMRRTARRSSM